MKVANEYSDLKPPHLQVLRAIYVLSVTGMPGASDIQKFLSDGHKTKPTGALRKKLKYLEGLGLIYSEKPSRTQTVYSLTSKGQYLAEKYISITEGGITPPKDDHVTPVDRLHDLIVKIEYVKLPTHDDLVKYGFDYYTAMNWSEYTKEENNVFILITSKSIIIMPKYSIWSNDPYKAMMEALEDIKLIIQKLHEKYNIKATRIRFIDSSRNIEITNMHHGFQGEAFAKVLAYYGLLPQAQSLKDNYEHIEFDASQHIDPNTGEVVRVPEADLKHKVDAPDDFNELHEFEESFPDPEEAYEFAETLVCGKEGWKNWREIPKDITEAKKKAHEAVEEMTTIAQFMEYLTNLQKKNQEIMESWYRDQGALITGNMTLMQNVEHLVDNKVKEIKEENKKLREENEKIKKELEDLKKKSIWGRIKKLIKGEEE